MGRSAALYFSQNDLDLARENREREPVKGALPLLDAPPDDPLEAAQIQALNFLFREDEKVGRAALSRLKASGARLDDSPSPAALRRQLGWLSVMSMLQAHPQWPTAEAACYAAQLEAAKRHKDALEESDLEYHCWLMAVLMALDIVMENENTFKNSADFYRKCVDDCIHPEGYFRGIVDIDGASETFAAQLSATGAMALMAEMAGQNGVDLWGYSNRGVSLITAATYTFYYYFFPERWKWEDGLTREQTMSLMRRDGAFFEMVNRRSPLRGVEQLFAEQRPYFSAYAGLTSLTHGLAPPKKKRWRFW